MASVIVELNRAYRDEQFGTIYETADKFGVGVCLYGNTPSPTRDSFHWLITRS